MRFEGFWLKPDGKKNKYWHIEVPILGICTQGKSKQDAFLMIKDAIELAVESKGFKVKVLPGDDNTFTVGANNTKVFVAFMLKQQRSSHGLTLQEVANRLKVASPNAYARYEQGKSVPTVEKLTELLLAIDPEHEPILKVT
ncbi:MAG: type II toxin-antitoxin system HicB family antitoxin [Deltaproteobacteria bacterium]|nr:type II toxin-antitoxin system HicB family antitoxin [Deltaproteobacteria bacterium]